MFVLNVECWMCVCVVCSHKDEIVPSKYSVEITSHVKAKVELSLLLLLPFSSGHNPYTCTKVNNRKTMKRKSRTRLSYFFFPFFLLVCCARFEISTCFKIVDHGQWLCSASFQMPCNNRLLNTCSNHATMNCRLVPVQPLSFLWIRLTFHTALRFTEWLPRFSSHTETKMKQWDIKVDRLCCPPEHIFLI